MSPVKSKPAKKGGKKARKLATKKPIRAAKAPEPVILPPAPPI